MSSSKRSNTSSTRQDGKRQRVDSTPRPPFMRMPEPWYPDGSAPPRPSPPDLKPVGPTVMPPNPVPMHLRMKMPEPEDIDISPPCCEECCGPPVQHDPPRPAWGGGSGGQQGPQQNLNWTTYDAGQVTAQNPYARPITYYGPQPPANAPRPVMWWATQPRQNPPPFPYDARRSDPYRRQ